MEGRIYFNQTLFVAFPPSLFVSDEAFLEASSQQQSNFVQDFQIKDYLNLNNKLASLKASLKHRASDLILQSVELLT